ncbi:MAG: L,D-transpeptidase [Anaerolineaceae bacterium]|nr:L,D-transpeptidase [Anaerolineaceae bacterium]
MNQRLTRRGFLKTSALGLTALAFRSVAPFNRWEAEDSGDIARVTIDSVSVHSQAWDESRIVSQRLRDEIVHLYYRVISDHGPAHNPIWYRVWGGYIHSARLQHVKSRLNPVAAFIRQPRQLAEVTVPYTQSMRYRGNNTWEPLYRLYYESVHWVEGLLTGPDGGDWYRIWEAWSKLTYDVPAAHLRIIPDEELAPISPDVPVGKKRVEISIANQTLKAYEDNREVFATRISSGLNRNVPEGEIPWRTPTGTFHIISKMPSKHMGDGDLTSDIEAYELPGVPWVCFFHETGVATHGTYWHTNYGTPMSHGCINMRTEEAKWFYRWTTPTAGPQDSERRGYGTRIIVA